MLMNFISFCLFSKVFIPPVFLKDSFSGYRIFGWQFISFNILNMWSNPLLAWKVYIEKSANSLMKVPLCVTSLFSLAALRIHSLSLTFDNLMCFSAALFELKLFRVLCALWSWMFIYFFKFRKFSTSVALNILSVLFSFLSPSGIPIIWIFVCWMIALSLSNFLFCSCILFHIISFLISYNCMYVLIAHLRGLFWILCLTVHRSPFWGVSYWNFINFPGWGHIYLIFHGPSFLTLVSPCLSNWAPLPDFAGVVCQRGIFTSQLCLCCLVCLLVISLSRRGLLLCSVWGARELFELWEQGWMGVTLAETVWIELLIWFPM